MNKRAIPYAMAESAYAIPLSFYKDNGIKVVLFDLDNTLSSFKDAKPSERTLKLIANLKENGIFCAIASNNTSKRVETFAKDLGIPAYCNLKKPFAGPLKKLIKREGFTKEGTVLIGDQILTDTYAGNGAGIRVILTKPIVAYDPIWTRVNRFLSKRTLKKLYEEPYRSQWRIIE